MDKAEDRYPVPLESARAEIKVRRSTFLACVEPARSTEQARLAHARIREEHHKARHHCPAWRFGPPSLDDVYSSDDGEPSGSAGQPILGEIRRSGLSDLLVVVVRWFGGVKLGTGGLVRAYGEAARAALEDCPREERIRRSRLRAVLPWERMTLFKRLMDECDALEEGARPGVEAELLLALPLSREQEFLKRAEVLLQGRGKVEPC